MFFFRRNDLKGRAQDVMSDSQDLFRDSRDLVRAGAGRAGEMMEERPVLSALIGAGTGLLLGFLFGGRPEPEPAPRRSRSTPAKPRRATRSS